MAFQLVKKENNDVTIEMTVTWDDFAGAVQTAYLANRGRFNLPGFRKGKAPRKIIEAQYGEGIFYEDAVNELLPKLYSDAIDGLSLEPVDRPEIDIKSLEKGEDVVIEAVVTVRPEVELGAYKGLEIEKVDDTVSEEDVEKELEANREMNARVLTIEEGAVAEGDTVTMDFEGFVDGEAFEGGKGEDYELEIGSGQFIPGFEDALIGATIGEETNVEVTFPEEYHAEELAGKEATFKVTVHEAKRKELPALDDEFAKDTSEFETLEELKAHTRKDLEEGAKRSAESALRDRVIDKAIENMTVQVPEAMINAEIDGMLNDFDQQLKMQGLSLEQYMQFTGGNDQALREQMKDDALARVKTGLLIDAIAEAEAVEVTDEDVEKEIERIAELQDRELDEIKALFEGPNGEALRQNLKENLRSKKTVDFLVDNATIV
jgi:trigger factor